MEMNNPYDDLTDEQILLKRRTLKELYPEDKLIHDALKAVYEGQIQYRKRQRRILGLPEGFEDFNG